MNRLPVDRASHLGGALQFFYDTPKVLMLLAGVALTLLFATFVAVVLGGILLCQSQKQHCPN